MRVLHCFTVFLMCGAVLAQRKEIFGFYTGGEDWRLYDWHKLTSISIFNGQFHPALIHTAKAHNVSVVFSKHISIECTLNATCRKEWILSAVGVIRENGLDGLNMDVEWPAADPSPERGNLTLLVKETNHVFTKLGIPQLTFDVAWSPDCIDERCYDYVALSENVDFFFIMMYATQSQMGDPPCMAKPDAPIQHVISGVYKFLELGIPASKLVLGLPWKGFDYPCTEVSNGTCYINPAPFRGSQCSDAAGRGVHLSTLLTTYGNLLTDSILELSSVSMRYDYEEDGQPHRVWYDNAATLQVKYGVAEEMGLRGVGIWNLECLYYGKNDTLMQVTDQMWSVLPKYN